MSELSTTSPDSKALAFSLIQGITIPYNPKLSRVIGSSAAIALQQFYYLITWGAGGWYDKEGNKWIYNTAQQWQDYLGLTEWEFRRAIDVLGNKAHSWKYKGEKKDGLGILIKEKLSKRWFGKDRKDQKLYYRIDEKNLTKFLADYSLDFLSIPESLAEMQTEGLQPRHSENPLSLEGGGSQDHKQRSQTKIYQKQQQANTQEALPAAKAVVVSSTASDTERQEAFDAVVTFLTAVGESEKKAQKTATSWTRKFSAREILNQIKWLDCRKVKTTKQALLYSAIANAYSDPTVPQPHKALQIDPEVIKAEQEIQEYVATLTVGQVLYNNKGEAAEIVKVDPKVVHVKLTTGVFYVPHDRVYGWRDNVAAARPVDTVPDTESPLTVIGNALAPVLSHLTSGVELKNAANEVFEFIQQTGASVWLYDSKKTRIAAPALLVAKWSTV